MDLSTFPSSEVSYLVSRILIPGALFVMAAKLRVEGTKINSELSSFHSEVGELALNIQKMNVFFSYIEDQCADLNHEKCLAQHDKFKQQLNHMHRQRFKEYFEVRMNCTHEIHHLYDWEEVVPVNSEEQLVKARKYLDCFRPCAKKLLEIGSAELTLLEKATKELKRMANIKD